MGVEAYPTSESSTVIVTVERPATVTAASKLEPQPEAA
jgi:hypothetical protein